MMNTSSPQSIDILVQRQLDVISSGNGAYLEMFLRQAKEAKLATRIIFSPWHSFGNRPWCSTHERFDELVDEYVWPHTIKLKGKYWSLSPPVWSRFAMRLLKALKQKAGNPVHIESYLGVEIADNEATVVAGICNARPATITIAEYSSMGPVLKKITPDSKFGVLMHDVLSDRGPRFRKAGLTPDFPEISRQQEVEWVNNVDLLIHASANELQDFAPMIPTAESVWLRPEPPTYETPNDSGTHKVVFLGTQHAGNSDTLDHFLKNIWPLIYADCPAVEFHIVGSIGKQLSTKQRQIPGVKVLGRVERLEDIGGENSIGISPTRLASGVSIKVVEYLMLGMPTVVYPLALEGFGDVMDELVIIKPDESTFAQAVVDLLNDSEQRKSMSVVGREKTKKLMSNHEVVASLKALAASATNPK